MKKVIKVAVVGPESTGKTELSRQLAEHYKTGWVPEAARAYLENLSGTYELKDLGKIARLQLKSEDEFTHTANNLLICDTNLIVIKVWSDFKYGKTEPWIIEKIKQQDYFLHLLTDIDMPWQFDPLREHPHRRKELFEIYLSELNSFSIPYQVISGLGNKRTANAVSAIDSALKNLLLPESGRQMKR